ncbi:CCA tRNA nucleotidyltransferase [bacterium]|nr:CCA tRNA nucleotidyltransferase [Nanoarchaeota archaeon]MBU1917243.1 CCA tRNA nucleotidyltransferase [bacterium]
MKKLLEKIKAKLKPEKEVIKEIDTTIKKVNNLLKKENIKAECVKGGSTAKGTFLRNDYDADLFVRFEKGSKNISDVLEKTLKKEFKIERVHGSRDYFQMKNKLLYEIVPVIKIVSYKEAENVTDMSPLHVDYINKKLKKGQTDEIRLAKKFCKSAKVYGAESYIKGFSGHILDLLIINYGSFEKLIKTAVNWKPKVIIDIEKHLKNPIKELDSSKTHSPLIIVDPVQPNRNAAAALNKEQFDLFIERCKQFLMKPSEEFFKIKKLDKEKIKRKVLSGEELLFFEAEPLKGKKDVTGSKLLKAYKHIEKELQKNDFEIKKTEWEFQEKNRFYFILKKEKLSEKKTLTGPPTEMKEAVKEFQKKHKKTFVEKERIYAEEKREYRLAKDLIRDLMKDEYVKERVVKIKLF